MQNLSLVQLALRGGAVRRDEEGYLLYRDDFYRDGFWVMPCAYCGARAASAHHDYGYYAIHERKFVSVDTCGFLLLGDVDQWVGSFAAALAALGRLAETGVLARDLRDLIAGKLLLLCCGAPQRGE